MGECQCQLSKIWNKKNVPSIPLSQSTLYGEVERHKLIQVENISYYNSYYWDAFEDMIKFSIRNGLNLSLIFAHRDYKFIDVQYVVNNHLNQRLIDLMHEMNKNRAGFYTCEEFALNKANKLGYHGWYN